MGRGAKLGTAPGIFDVADRRGNPDGFPVESRAILDPVDPLFLGG